MVTQKQKETCQRLYEKVKSLRRQKEKNRKEILAFSKSVSDFYQTVKTTWDSVKQPAHKSSKSIYFYCEAERVICVIENLNIFFTRVNRQLDQIGLVHDEVKGIVKKMREHDKIIGTPEISHGEAEKLLVELNRHIDSI